MKYVLFLFLAALPLGGFSQSRLLDIQSSQFDYVFGFDMQETSGGYLIAGTGGSNLNAGFYCWITKTDTAFNTLWSKKFQLSGEYYQVNSSTITLSSLANDQIILLAKTRSEDSVFTELSSFDQNGNFLWGKKWTNLFIYSESVDMNKIVPLSDSTFHLSHSVINGSTHLKVQADGTVLSSKYTHLTDLNDTIQGVSNLLCSDGGILQILRSYDRRTVLVKLNEQHQVMWAKEIQSFNRFIWIVNAFENPDGSFWLFGSITEHQSSPSIDQSLAVMKLSANGTLDGVYYYNNQQFPAINMGIAQVYPISPNEFVYNSTEGHIGSLNLNTGIAKGEQLDIFQANHGFQNLHKLSNGYYALTGMGLNWIESKIHIFPGIADHPCLQVFINMRTANQDTIPMQEIQVSDITAVADNYSTGTAFNPVIETADILFGESCYVGLEELAPDLGLSIYPNPASSHEFVTLKWDGEHSSEKIILGIFDLQGTRVYHSELDGSTDYHTIDIHLLPVGMYFVNCTIPGTPKNFTSKLVIR